MVTLYYAKVSKSLPDGKVGTAYSTTLQTTGLTPPLKWSVTPKLPDELVFDDVAGTISGTPTKVFAKATAGPKWDQSRR
jgi:hypothetical protein